jgi:hypothetical protein
MAPSLDQSVPQYLLDFIPFQQLLGLRVYQLLYVYGEFSSELMMIPLNQHDEQLLPFHFLQLFFHLMLPF